MEGSVFEIAGIGDDARRLPRCLGAPAPGARRGRGRRAARHGAAARAPADLHRRQAHRAARAAGRQRRRAGHRRRPRRQDHLPRPRPDRGLPDRPAARARAGRRLRTPPRGGDDRDLRRLRRGHRARPRPQRRLAPRRRAAPGAQGRRDRAARRPGRDHARHRTQLRRGPGVVRPVRPLRHRRRRASPRSASRPAARSACPRCCRSCRRGWPSCSPGRRTPRRRTTSPGPTRPRGSPGSSWSAPSGDPADPARLLRDGVVDPLAGLPVGDGRARGGRQRVRRRHRRRLRAARRRAAPQRSGRRGAGRVRHRRRPDTAGAVRAGHRRRPGRPGSTTSASASSWCPARALWPPPSPAPSTPG